MLQPIREGARWLDFSNESAVCPHCAKRSPVPTEKNYWGIPIVVAKFCPRCGKPISIGTEVEK